MNNNQDYHYEETKLAYNFGSSDKVYEVELCKVNLNDSWVVNFKYGRRGSRLNEGSKTPFPLPYYKAVSVYQKLINSKLNKGYFQLTTSRGMTEKYRLMLLDFAKELNANQQITDDQINSLIALLNSNNYESAKLAEEIISVKAKTSKTI